MLAKWTTFLNPRSVAARKSVSLACKPVLPLGGRVSFTDQRCTMLVTAYVLGRGPGVRM